MQEAGSDPHEMATFSFGGGLPNAPLADDSTDVVLLRKGKIVLHRLLAEGGGGGGQWQWLKTKFAISLKYDYFHFPITVLYLSSLEFSYPSSLQITPSKPGV